MFCCLILVRSIRENGWQIVTLLALISFSMSTSARFPPLSRHQPPLSSRWKHRCAGTTAGQRKRSSTRRPTNGRGRSTTSAARNSHVRHSRALPAVLAAAAAVQRAAFWRCSGARPVVPMRTNAATCAFGADGVKCRAASALGRSATTSHQTVASAPAAAAAAVRDSKSGRPIMRCAGKSGARATASKTTVHQGSSNGVPALLHAFDQPHTPIAQARTATPAASFCAATSPVPSVHHAATVQTAAAAMRRSCTWMATSRPSRTSRSRCVEKFTLCRVWPTLSSDGTERLPCPNRRIVTHERANFCGARLCWDLPHQRTSRHVPWLARGET